MPVDEGTQAAVRALWQAGSRHGRPPAPVPEADPWEADDPVDGPPRTVSVVFDGVPGVVVHLHRDGADLVAVEGCVEIEVPRRDVVEVLEGLLGGRARRRPRVRGYWRSLASGVLGSPAPSDLEVPAGGRVYAGPILFAPPLSGWLLSRPVAEE
ncbi:hypothetical protein CHO01_06570 [Cellulomonas hominis]|uniref:Uncharacterized protein n=1 Tax=Cellulomonas hominis TaxID=156981 RepID=A0A511F8B8_9CELL|nr:hypothetical protein [Cellulomonas hominis]MBB5474372.1 hypothetical protein [Cellulomonas hominis]GEL45541.1 hypothetical protein CHO01_06570 [Cellulomonas hominis]